MYEEIITLQPEPVPVEGAETVLLPEIANDVFNLPDTMSEDQLENSQENIEEEVGKSEEIQEEPQTSRSQDNKGDEKPFAVILRQKEKQKNGNFRPSASIEIRPSLRTSGFLQTLSGEDLKNLLLLFTYLSPNGDIAPTIHELGEALGVSPDKVKNRMKPLLQARWNDQPIVVSMLRESGLDAYTPTHHILCYVLATSDIPNREKPIRAAGRDRVIAYSRQRYGRPRAEVERDIAIQNGWPLPKEELATSMDNPIGGMSEAESAEYLKQRLFRAGVLREEVEYLLANFPQSMIEDQLAWLPYRHAKSPSRYLIAAIKGDYDEPFAMKMQKHGYNNIADDSVSQTQY